MWVQLLHARRLDPADSHTFYLGLGARVRIRPTVYVSAEVSPRLAGLKNNDDEYGFAIEKRAGAHVFQLNFSKLAALDVRADRRGRTARVDVSRLQPHPQVLLTT